MMQAYRTENSYRSAARLSPAELRAAMASGEILQATALAFDTRRQLRFELGGVKAVMPFAQCADGAETGTVRDIAVLTRVGRPTCFVIEGIDRSKAALIVTRNPDAICRALGEAFGTGMTCIPAQGGFSHEEMTIVYFVVNRFQISRMKDIVHDLDDRAYITISEVADVFKLNQDKLSQKVDNQPLLPRRK